MKKDTLYQSTLDPLAKVRSFAFDENVVPVFQDMISRSVPGYETMLRGIGVFAMRYAQEGTRLYDLGCSLGAVAFVLSRSTEGRDCPVIAVDNSKPMIDACRERLSEEGELDSISLVHDDIDNVAFENASVIVSNFTLQFIAQEKRDGLIQKIFDGLEEGGVFILSEKIRALDNADNLFLIDHYHGYKKINGYTDEEISRKREALENVLIPDSLSGWEARLKGAGFSETHQWFRCFNFVSLIAIKGSTNGR